MADRKLEGSADDAPLPSVGGSNGDFPLTINGRPGSSSELREKYVATSILYQILM